MRQRHFIIEPNDNDPDTFCNFIVGTFTFIPARNIKPL